MQKEIWKDVKGYEGYYKISNKGIVKSVYRAIFKSNGVTNIFKGKTLKAHINKYGYKTISLSNKGIEKKVRLHQLLAVAFLGHKINRHKKVIDHIDNNKLNNDLSNLQIITNRHNASKDTFRIKNKTSKYVGVSYRKSGKRLKRWRATIKINGKQVFLGNFKNEIDAHFAYQNALKNL